MRWRTARGLAWGLFALGCVAFAALLALEATTGKGVGRGVSSDGAFLPVFVSFAGVGAVIVSRQPRNPVGWSMLAFVLMPFGLLQGAYADHAATLPVVPGGAAWAAWLFQIAISITVVPFVLTLVLFPDGHPPSRRWRLVIWLALIATLIACAGTAFGVTQEFTANFPSLTHPLQLLPASTAETISNVGALLIVLAFALAAASPFFRYRRASGDEREQVKWVAWAAALFATAFALMAIATNEPVIAFILFVPLVPVAIGVAILKYRLYDVDVVINKTVVYGALALFITVVYVVVVVGVGSLVGAVGSPALSAVAAAVVALAFQPARRHAQHLADRLVYGARATPYEVLSEFSERLGGTYAAEELLPRMARILAEGTGASRADVWLRVGDELRADASWPTDVDRLQALPVDEMPVELVPVRHQGELLGALGVTKKPGEAMTPTEEKLVADLASQAGLVLRNVGLTEQLLARLDELKASRQRLVTAQDEERRKIERNLHDGAQQQLVALAVKARLAQGMAAKDAARTEAMLAELQAELADALEELRDLARGIYPPLLADQGLPAALEAQARKSPVPVRVRAAGIGRFPQEAEAAVYFCCLEALQNVAKYANATGAVVTLSNGAGELRFEVADDGAGFDPSGTGYGTGLQGMADRLAALGGDLEVTSAPGTGTTVAGRLPLGGTT